MVTYSTNCKKEIPQQHIIIDHNSSIQSVEGTSKYLCLIIIVYECEKYSPE